MYRRTRKKKKNGPTTPRPRLAYSYILHGWNGSIYLNAPLNDERRKPFTPDCINAFAYVHARRVVYASTCFFHDSGRERERKKRKGEKSVIEMEHSGRWSSTGSRGRSAAVCSAGGRYSLLSPLTAHLHLVSYSTIVPSSTPLRNYRRAIITESNRHSSGISAYTDRCKITLQRRLASVGTKSVREARELYRLRGEGRGKGGPRVSLVRVIGKRRVIEASLVRGVALCSPLMLMQPS